MKAQARMLYVALRYPVEGECTGYDTGSAVTKTKTFKMLDVQAATVPAQQADEVACVAALIFLSSNFWHHQFCF